MKRKKLAPSQDVAFDQSMLKLYINYISLVALLVSSFGDKETNKFLDTLGCPIDRPQNRAIVESFIDHAAWAAKRVESGTDQLTTNQIELLEDPTDQAACAHFNTSYADAIAMKIGSTNDPRYHIIYYKAGDFYFVTLALAQPPNNPDYIIVGLSFLGIYDDNFDRVAGYGF